MKMNKFFTNVELTNNLMDDLNRRLMGVHKGHLSIAEFLKYESEIVPIINKAGFNVSPITVVNNVEEEFRKLPMLYTVNANNVTIHEFIKEQLETEKNKKVSAIKNYINDKGLDYELFKFLFKGTKFNKGKIVEYKNDKGKLVQGEIIGLYIGNKPEYPIRYKIYTDKINNKTTDVYENNCTFI